MKTIDSLVAERDDAENRAEYAEARLAKLEDALREILATVDADVTKHAWNPPFWRAIQDSRTLVEGS